MTFWFVPRSTLEEVRARLAERDQTIEALTKKLFRLEDIIYKHHFGIQVNDTLPEPQGEYTPEPTEEPTSDYESQVAEIKAQLRATMRSNPSQLGPQLPRAKMKTDALRAKAARPFAVPTQ
jgi:hypothetical protein